jgi:hypothetical protein
MKDAPKNAPQKNKKQYFATLFYGGGALATTLLVTAVALSSRPKWPASLGD